jgi:hypothetical protein
MAPRIGCAASKLINWGHQNAALFDAALEAFRLVFRHAHAGQRADNTGHCSHRAHTGDGGHNRPRGSQRSQARNRQHTYAGQPAQHAPGNATHDRSRRCAFRRLRIFFLGKVFGTLVFLKQHGDIRTTKSGCA